MKNIKFVIETGYVNADWEETVRFNDDVTDEELEKYMENMRDRYINTYYEEVDEEDEEGY